MSTAFPIATVSWICQFFAPSSMIVSMSSGRSGIVSAPICVLTLVVRPASRARRKEQLAAVTSAVSESGTVLAEARPLQEAPALVQSLGYMILGLAWILPLMPLIKWMERPERGM